MNPLKWIERKTSLKGVDKEYHEIESKESSGFGCKLRLYSMAGDQDSVCKLRISQVGEVGYYDLDDVAAETLMRQLEEILEERKHRKTETSRTKGS